MILLYAMYGAYISSLYILAGDKGSLGSKHFLFFIIVSLLLVISNVGKLSIVRIIENKEKSIILIFLLYMVIRLIFVDSETQERYIGIIFSDIGTSFISGFIAFSVFESRIPIVSNIMRGSRSTKGNIASVLLGTFIFIGCMLYFLTQFLGVSLTSVFQVMALSNVYYQEFGDLVTIGYCCLVSLQISYFKSHLYPKGFLLLVTLLVIQTTIAVVVLQTVNSSKSVATIVLICALTIFFCKPQNWLVDKWKIKTKAIYVVPFLLFICLLILQFLQQFPF